MVGGQGGTARVTWRANWDRDERPLSYDVLRRNGSAPEAVVRTVTQASTFWNRPTVAFTDRGLDPGRTYSYRIRARHRRQVAQPGGVFTYAGAAAGGGGAEAEARAGEQRRLSGAADLTGEPAPYRARAPTRRPDDRASRCA